MQYFFVFYFFSFFILLAVKPEKYGEFSYAFNFTLSLVYGLLLIAFLWQQRRVTRNWLRPDVIFLIGFTIVHIQIPFLASIGVEPYMPDFVWVNKEVVNYATWMSVVAACSWMLGFSLLSKHTESLTPLPDKQFGINFRVYDTFLLVVFFSFIMLVGQSFLKGAYNNSAWGSGASYAYLILGSMLHLRIIYFFKDMPYGATFRYLIAQGFNNKIFFSVLLAYCALFMMTGSRGEILSIVLVVATVYSIFVKPVSLKAVIIGVMIGAVLFNILGAGRGRDHTQFEDGNIFARGYESLQQSESKKGITSELASSVRIQYRAIDTVPDKHPYLYGVTYITAITSAVPFLTGLYLDLFDVPYQYGASTRFFTFIGQGQFHSYGEGSEILADIYINFGLVSVFVIMFVFGAFLGLVSHKGRGKKFNYLIIYVAFSMSAIYINRSHLLLPLASIVYLYFLHLMFSKKKMALN